MPLNRYSIRESEPREINIRIDTPSTNNSYEYLRWENNEQLQGSSINIEELENVLMSPESFPEEETVKKEDVKTIHEMFPGIKYAPNIFFHLRNGAYDSIVRLLIKDRMGSRYNSLCSILDLFYRDRKINGTLLPIGNTNFSYIFEKEKNPLSNKYFIKVSNRVLNQDLTYAS